MQYTESLSQYYEKSKMFRIRICICIVEASLDGRKH
jgi:hypothetical protein